MTPNRSLQYPLAHKAYKYLTISFGLNPRDVDFSNRNDFKAIWTGELKNAKRGDWFLNLGIDGFHAHYAKSDLTRKVFIAKIIQNVEVVTHTTIPLVPIEPTPDDSFIISSLRKLAEQYFVITEIIHDEYGYSIKCCYKTNTGAPFRTRCTFSEANAWWLLCGNIDGICAN